MGGQIMITARIQGTALHRVRRIAAQVRNPRALFADVGRRVANELRKHYRDLDAKHPNRMGGKRVHFWNQVRSSVSDAKATSRGAKIIISHPAILQKLYGGTIKSDDKLLAIPANAAAYGRSPRVMGDRIRFVLFGRTGTKALVDRSSGQVMYWLKEQVTQKAFPNTLPKESDLARAIEDTAQKHLNRLLRN